MAAKNPRRALMLALHMVRAEALEICEAADRGRFVPVEELDAAVMVRDWTATERAEPEFR